MFGNPLDVPITLPSWLSEEEVQYYVSKFEKSGFTGALNYYRCLDLYVQCPFNSFSRIRVLLSSAQISGKRRYIQFLFFFVIAETGNLLRRGPALK